MTKGEIVLRGLSGHLKNNVVAYIALMTAVIFGGGGYAVAATTHAHAKKKKTAITACVSRRSGEMFLHKGSGRCAKGRHKVKWNIKGKTGARGRTGASGASAPSVYAAVDGIGAASGGAAVITGQGLSVTREGVGVYQVTITDATCSQTEGNVPVVTPTLRNAQYVSNEAPVAFIDNNIGLGSFTVSVGYDNSSGTFVPTDYGFDVVDSCQS